MSKKNIREIWNDIEYMRYIDKKKKNKKKDIFSESIDFHYNDNYNIMGNDMRTNIDDDEYRFDDSILEYKIKDIEIEIKNQKNALKNIYKNIEKRNNNQLVKVEVTKYMELKKKLNILTKDYVICDNRTEQSIINAIKRIRNSRWK